MADLHPYLHFMDNTRQAMEFYQSIFGGELEMHTFAEFGPSQDPAEANKIMHASLTAPDFAFMASDTPNGMEFRPGDTISMSLSGNDADKLRRYWEGLSQGATIEMPLEPAPWGDTFGSLKDKFGIEWLVNITGSH